MKIIDGKKLAKIILENVGKEISKLGFKPIFCDVLVGRESASIQYVRMKQKTAESVGISFHTAFFEETITTEELVKEIKAINKIPNMCGVIVQLPLPLSIDMRTVLDAIDPKLDVDCLGTIASTEFYNGHINDKSLGFPTALACMTIIDSLSLYLKDKKIVILGQGQLVGKPVTALFKFMGLMPMIIVSETENKAEVMREADIIISGVGKGKFITGNMLKKGVILIDAGTSESNSGIVGDIDIESVKDKASFISPVPGGVGPVTVSMLLSNVLKVAKNISTISSNTLK
jgi:methylenetetrahydrofolate dehydrogenase (NADP+)/methenyltetrahydrofolate cyclohydrolase